MRVHRFYYNFSPNEKKVKIQDKSLIHQLRNILRMKKGQEIILFNEKEERKGEIILLTKDFLEIVLKEEIKSLKESRIYVCLFASLLKRENFEILVEKVTEIGVKEIYPLICKRTVKLNFKEERLKRIIKEASEQCGRKSLTILHPPFEFEKAINLVNNQANFFLDFFGENFQKVVRSFPLEKMERVNLFLGPEGGWSEEERKKVKEKNFLVIKISDLIFRSETAGIVGSYLFSHFLDFLS